MAHWLFLPNDALGDLQILTQLPTEKIARLRTLLDSSDFRLRYKFYVSLAESLSIPDESAARLCSFVNYVQTQRKHMEQSADTVIDELKSFIKRHPKIEVEESKDTEKKLDEKRSLLSGLFGQLPRREFSQKRRGLETGPLPHLVSMRTYCDLRPIYDQEATTIQEMFPIVTLHMVTHSESSDKTTEVYVQLSESDVTEIKAQIERLERKLEQLEKHKLITSASNGVKP